MGSFVLSLNKISKFLNKEPPPESTIPLSTISAAHSTLENKFRKNKFKF